MTTLNNKTFVPYLFLESISDLALIAISLFWCCLER